MNVELAEWSSLRLEAVGSRHRIIPREVLKVRVNIFTKFHENFVFSSTVFNELSKILIDKYML